MVKMKITRSLFCFAAFMFISVECTKSQRRSLRWVTKKEALIYLTTDMSDMETFKRNKLDPMLTERISGTSGNVVVREHIRDHMEKLGWHVEEDVFEDETPFGRKRFANIIATQKPSCRNRTIVACHYDSKDFRTKEGKTFIGATDSAVPCAIMLEAAHQLNCLLLKGPRDGSSVSDLTLQLVFFDGEEAFNTWNDADSIYGARHMAEKWTKNESLSSIRELILLDLIGHSKTTFHSHFDATSSLFEHLMKIERHLRNNGYLSAKHTDTMFSSYKSFVSIQDDHFPFLNRGVDVLHLISTPFPPVWHQVTDNGDHLNFDLINNFSRVFRVFLVNLLHLDPEHIACRKK